MCVSIYIKEDKDLSKWPRQGTCVWLPANKMLLSTFLPPRVVVLATSYNLFNIAYIFGYCIGSW